MSWTRTNFLLIFALCTCVLFFLSTNEPKGAPMFEDRFVVLRSLLYGPQEGGTWSEFFSQELPAFFRVSQSASVTRAWEQLLGLFDSWEPSAEREAALSYANEHLSLWPDECRVMDRFRPGHAAWPLVRSCTFFEDTLDMAFGVRGTEPATSLLEITHLFVRNLGDFSKVYRLRLLPALRGLVLYDHHRVNDLYELQALSQLRSLSFFVRKGRRYHAGILDDISALSSLGQLEELALKGCSAHCSMEPIASCQKLKHLWLEPGHGLQNMQLLGALEALSFIRFESAFSVESLEGIEGLQALQRLYIDGCGSLASLGQLNELPSLDTLSIRNCFSVPSFAAIDDSPSLQRLELQHNESLRSLVGLKRLPALELLAVHGFLGLEGLSGVESLPSLKQLSVSDCPRLTALHQVSTSPQLQDLQISRCLSFSLEQHLQEPSSLQTLLFHAVPPIEQFEPTVIAGPARLSWLEDAEQASSIPALAGLERLDVEVDFPISTLRGLEQMPALESLLIDATDLRSVQGVSSLRRLKSLHLKRSQMMDLKELKPCEHLEELTIENASHLLSLDGLESCERMVQLRLGPVLMLRGIRSLAQLPHLRELSLKGLHWFPHYDETLAQLHNLEVLSLQQCENLEQLDWILSFKHLRELHISSCPQLKQVFALAHLPALERLTIRDCGMCFPLPRSGFLTGHVATREELACFQEKLLEVQQRSGTIMGRLERRVGRWLRF